MSDQLGEGGLEDLLELLVVGLAAWSSAGCGICLWL